MYAAQSTPIKPAPSAQAQGELNPPAVKVEQPAPVKRIKSSELKQLGNMLNSLWNTYRSDRRLWELRLLRNTRQYLGRTDPELDKQLSPQRSRAYPKLTRIKVISVLSRVMNLLHQGDARPWEVSASSSPDMSPQDVMQAIQEAVQRDQAEGSQPQIDDDYIEAAVKKLADARAKKISDLIDAQLSQLGGSTEIDYIYLNRQVLLSGLLHGIGLLHGPYARETKSTTWTIDPNTKQPVPKQISKFYPVFEPISVWEFYPDMGAKTLESMDGYFIRKVLARSQIRELADRPDFFGDTIKEYLRRNPIGNYKAEAFEWELRAEGVKANTSEQKVETQKYSVIVWYGPVTGSYLQLAGVDVPDDKLQDDMQAEVWLLDGNVIKADLNPYAKLNTDQKMLHYFMLDADDTSPVGQGLANHIRDTQMSLVAATRMLMDNASVTCGPQLELNTDLLREDQDLSAVTAFRIWAREGNGPESQWPAVRNVQIDSHMNELMEIIKYNLDLADKESFVGPATGGDMSKGPSEPLRTAAGASMLRGDAALPFKDIVRGVDRYTQGLIQSIIIFNRKFNPDITPEADYNIIARGASSLVAKEVRAMQLDALAQTLTPAEMLHVDERKLVEARLSARDLTSLLISPDEAARRQQAQQQQAQQQQQQQQELQAANVRKLLSDAFKNVAQGQKNSANADAVEIQSALDILEKGLQHAGLLNTMEGNQNAGSQGANNPPEQPPQGGPGVMAGPDVAVAPGQPGAGMPPQNGFGGSQ